MTKLHDEIENAIKKLIKDYSTYFTINPSQLRDYIVEYLGKYLTIPLELVDEIWGMKVYKSDNTHHTQLTDQKLIDKIISIIRENLWQDYNIDLWDCIKSELGVYLTQPTDEGIEKEEPKDNEPLPEKEIDDKTKLGIYDTTQNIMQDIRTYVYEYDEVQKMRLLALLDKHLLKFGGQEQSTPKIEESLESKFEALSKLVWGLVVLVDEHLDYHKKYKL